MHSNEKNNRLYHFTTMNGLKGIIGDNKLWFTDYRFLNDKDEISKAYNILIKKLKERDYIKSSIEMHLNFRNFSRDYSLGICSFSNNYDSLAQWRLYSDNCKGACIGFNRSSWDNRAQANWKTFPPLNGSIYEDAFNKPFITELIECSYKDIDLFVEQIILDFEKYFIDIENSEFKPKIIKSITHDGKSEYINLIKKIASWKHPDFSYEQEERAISIVPKKDVKIRVTDISLIPYYELEIGKSFFIDEYELIILGSKCDPNTNETIEYLLDYHVDYEEEDGEGFHKLEYYAKVLAQEYPDKYKAFSYCAHQITPYR